MRRLLVIVALSMAPVLAFAYQRPPNLSQVAAAIAYKLGVNVSSARGGRIALSNNYACDYRSITALDAYGRSDCFLDGEYMESFCIADGFFSGYRAFRCNR